MTKDILFLLAPGIHDNDRREYCPACAEIWGLLSYYPAIMAGLDIRYQPIMHPREGLTALLGDGRWNCPTLVLGQSVDDAVVDQLGEEVGTANGHRFLDNARAIGNYFAHRYGTAFPR